MKQKQTIKLNESQLRNIIKESVKKVLNERVRPVINNDVEMTFKEDFMKMQNDAASKLDGKTCSYGISCDEWWKNNQFCVYIIFKWDEQCEVYHLDIGGANATDTNIHWLFSKPVGNINALMRIIKNKVGNFATFRNEDEEEYNDSYETWESGGFDNP